MNGRVPEAQGNGGTAEPAYVPREGELTTDALTGRVGTVTAWDGALLTLKAPNGDEWETGSFRLPTARERLVPLVAEANKESQQGRGRL